jgi:hypothetical protein
VERKSDTELFRELNQEEQQIFMSKAKFLLYNGYIENQDVEELAIKIFSRRRVKKS